MKGMALRFRRENTRYKFTIALAISSLLLWAAARTEAGPVDLNGNALPDPSDGKAVKIDNSKEKEAPPVQQGCIAPKDLEFRVGIPGWLSAMSGDFGVKGVVAPLDVTFTEILRHMEHIPIVLSAYARYGRWELFGDGEYVQLHDSFSLPGLLFTNADLGLKYSYVEGFLGYRLINCENAFLSLYAGARYTYYSSEFSVDDTSDPRFPIIRQLLGIPQSGKISGSIDWVDPVVGVGGRVHLWKPISFWGNGDVGGFDVNGDPGFALTLKRGTPVLKSVDSSDWSYQIQGGLEIQITRWMWSQIGWRYLKYDFVSGGFTNKTDLNGPFIQTGINF
jgi:hypothetical protein